MGAGNDDATACNSGAIESATIFNIGCVNSFDLMNIQIKGTDNTCTIESYRVNTIAPIERSIFLNMKVKDGVITRTTYKGICTNSTIQSISTTVAIQNIVARLTTELIITWTTVECVVIILTRQTIVSSTANECIVTVRPNKIVIGGIVSVVDDVIELRSNEVFKVRKVCGIDVDCRRTGFSAQVIGSRTAIC